MVLSAHAPTIDREQRVEVDDCFSVCGDEHPRVREVIDFELAMAEFERMEAWLVRNKRGSIGPDISAVSKFDAEAYYDFVFRGFGAECLGVIASRMSEIVPNKPFRAWAQAAQKPKQQAVAA